MNDKILLHIETLKPFTGRVYAKGGWRTRRIQHCCQVAGNSDDSMCTQNYVQNLNDTFVDFNVSLGMCGMKRTKQVGVDMCPLVDHKCVQLEPAGMNMMLIIVVSFHQTFVTKVDRAYRVRCLFKNAPIMVMGSLDVR
jgi:hypothetical protein